VVVIVFGALRMKLSYARVFVSVRKVRLNLCFGTILPTIRRGLIITGTLKLLYRNVKQSKSLKLLIKSLNLFYASSRSLRLAYDGLIFVGSLLVERLRGNLKSKMASFHEDLKAGLTGIAIKR
jgi:hypothetical protein